MVVVGGGVMAAAKSASAAAKSACVPPHQAVWSDPVAEGQVGQGRVAHGGGGGPRR